MSGLVPFNPKQNAPTIFGTHTSLTRKEEKTIEHERDLAVRAAEERDVVIRTEFNLAATRADEQAEVRTEYIARRMDGIKHLGIKVISEQDERIQSLMSPFVEMSAEFERNAFYRNFR